jgi:hypothetical protein
MYHIANATIATARSFPLAAPEQTEIEAHALRHQRHVERYGEAVQRGDFSTARRQAENAIRCPSAKLSAAIRTYAGSKRARPRFTQLNYEIAHLFAKDAIKEPVRLKLKAKLGGGWRPVMDFGPKHRVFQAICADLLRAALPVNALEYNRTGRGDERMTLHILALMQERNLDHVVAADVRNCFGSVRKELVYQVLPLPRWMTEHIALLSDEKPIISDTIHNNIYLPTDEAACRGLPQGALTSSLIMSRAILGPLLGALPFADVTSLYGDNIFVLARGRAEAEARLGTLRSHLANSPVGPLSIGASHIVGASNKINLLKYARRPIPFIYGGGYRIGPSDKCYENFGCNLRDKILESTRDEIDDVISHYQERWVRAFPLWSINETNSRYLHIWARMTAILADACRQ